MRCGGICDVPRPTRAREGMGFSVQALRGSRESGQPLLPLRRNVERVAPGGDERETRSAFLGIHPNQLSLPSHVQTERIQWKKEGGLVTTLRKAPPPRAATFFASFACACEQAHTRLKTQKRHPVGCLSCL